MPRLSFIPAGTSSGAGLCAALLVLVAAQSAAAESPNAEYQRLIQQATQDYGSNNFAEAHAGFERAHRLNPNARTARGLGLSSFELRHYTVAIEELTAALNEARKPLTPKQRLEVEDVLKRAKGYVGTLRLYVTPEDARVMLDGHELEERRLSLDPGDYHLLAQAEGYRDREARIRIAGGDDQELAFSLEREAVTVPAPAEVAVEPPHEAPRKPVANEGGGGLGTQRVLALVAGGVGVAGIVVGSIFGLQSMAKKDDADAHCDGAVCRDQTGVDLRDDARTAGDWSTVGFVVGGVGLAGAAVLWFTAPSEEPEATEVQLGLGGARIRGTF